MKRLLRVVSVVLILLIVSAGAASAYIHLTGIPKYPTQQVNLKVEVTPERIERGRRTASMLCAGCHLNPTTGVLTGKRMEDAPAEFGVIYSKNITAHPVKGIGAWTDGEIAFLLRTGIRRDGQYTPPWMAKLPHMSDDDLHDVIAFLRSDDAMVKAADVDDRESEPTFLTKLLCRVAFKPFAYPTAKISPPDPKDKVALGRYLVAGKLDCYPCHSADFKTVDYYSPEASPGYLGGGNPMPDMQGHIVKTANLTPDGDSGIGRWSEAEFERALRRGVRPSNAVLRYPMLPYPELTDEEVSAIYAYLKTVPAIKNAVVNPPAPIPANASGGKQVYYKYSCNSCHGDTGVGLYDLRKGPIDFPTDEQLTAWVRDPSKLRPGVKMPTWDGVIEEGEYAPLIAYVRTLAAAGGGPSARP
jgi:mono/diheme cytochrome c family protein